jgi:hypothetical protein
MDGKKSQFDVLFARLQSVMRQGDFNPTLVQLDTLKYISCCEVLQDSSAFRLQTQLDKTFFFQIFFVCFKLGRTGFCI